jgi:hypothetical protein
VSTHLPADLFTPTEGSTYLLDGYPDTAYGEGTARKWDSATVRGLAGIPDGVIGGDVEWESDKAAAINYEGFVLPEELEADVHYDVVDHTWLDPKQPQDGSRLPKTPHVSVPQLEEAWGKGRRTDGIHLIAAIDKDRADYEASLKTGLKKASVPKAKIAEAISRAWRRVTAGTDFRTIGTEIANALGDDAHRAKAAFDEMRREAGLVGKVYIRADAYPKCAGGSWNDTVRKTACDAHYVQSKPECDGCVMAQQGRCAAFGGRRIVTEVPYAQALEVYGPRIAAAGVRVASGDPKEALRRGLREASTRKTATPETNFHVVSDAEAARVLHATTAPASIRTPDDVRRERELTAAQHRVARYVRDELISREDAAHLLRSVTDPAEMLRRAASVAARPRAASEYTGASNDLVSQVAQRGLSASDTPTVTRDADRRRVHAAVARWHRDGLLTAATARSLVASSADPTDVARAAAGLIAAAGMPMPGDAADLGLDARTATVNIDTARRSRKATDADVWRELRDAETRVARTQRIVERVAADRERASTRDGKRAARIARKVASVVTEIDRGVRGSALAGFIHRTIAPDEVREASVALDPVLRRTSALSEGPAKARAYTGAAYEAAPQFARTASEPAHGEVARLTRWARRLMTEGVAGSELDHRIAARFASSVRTAGTNVLATLRREHEGLSGHVYVDAAAYATKTGTGGCEEGARHHRANAVPAVLEMPSKCGGCVHRTARADGVVTCSLYAKPLIASAAEVVDDPKKHQRDMIRLADAPDQEATASLFTNSYDPTEFALGLDTELDHIDVEDMPEPEAVGQYLFGGIEIP